MPIPVQCSCGRQINASEQYAGKVVRCPQCKQPVAIPAVLTAAIAVEPILLSEVQVVPVRAVPVPVPVAALPVEVVDVEVVLDNPTPVTPVSVPEVVDVELAPDNSPPLTPVSLPEVVDVELAPDGPPAPGAAPGAHAPGSGSGSGSDLETLQVPAELELLPAGLAEELTFPAAAAPGAAPGADAPGSGSGSGSESPAPLHIDENKLRVQPLVKVDWRRPPVVEPPRRVTLDDDDHSDTYQMTAEGAALADRLGDTPAGSITHVGELGNFYVTPGDHTVKFVALSPDNSIALAGVEDMVCVLNVRSGQGILRFLGHQARVCSGCFTADGKLALTGDEDGDLYLWNVADGKVVSCMEVHDGPVHQVACAHGCALALSAGADGTARLWNLKRGKMVHHLQEGSAVTSVAFACDDTLVVTGTAAGRVTLWRTQELKAIEDLSHAPPGRITAVRFANDGRRLMAGGIEGGWRDSCCNVTRWYRRADTDPPRFHCDTESQVGNVLAVAFAGNGETLVCGGGAETETQVLRDGGGNGGVDPVLVGFVVGGLIGAIAAGAMTGASEGTSTVKRIFTPFKIANVDTGRVLKAFPGHMRSNGTATITCVALGPNGERGISGGDDGRVQIWGVG
jgi:WD40 repeat protein